MSREQRITDLLYTELNPFFLTVEDESHKHHVPVGAETHFKLVIVSEKFAKLTLIARHRLVNGLLSQEFNNGLHALSLHLYTEEEWETRHRTTTNSPACRDGYRHG
ncbi:TPA: BolA/IbaG family iron-sulfur metabolism protein [Legionella feeleii]|uniref:Regulator of penicillin binding proteins and beta lactamase transcription (Morphogene) n=1 Tax=Legionella feeleii TaxID=453 RepID=A0A0W0TUK4_9GAMM|nr:BolA/IbaG family iron-sulfur metabolism protein [Legionella feeleii]KTC99289.1 regulator of penicillin binding proteins and beta lactamase transcription (morphogene) [Legionella feeleii]SPX62646.1 regulator of penicillin binding proteins and beta lactamase transcription (morphogene) [Legionella feeleii]STX39115.1 regulator of penicillin binding proteins and beta lactamase transcription (morphogene) [Legionella feeleii]